MTDPYPEIEPYEHGMLDVGDGHHLHNAWLEDGSLLRGACSLAGIPGILVNGRFDFGAPMANAWELKRVWPRAELVSVDDAGHAFDNAGISQALVRATNRFAAPTR